MNRIFGVLLAVVFCSQPIWAQMVSIYGTFSVPHLWSVEPTDLSTNSAGVRYYPDASFWSPGFGGGVMIETRDAGVLRFGVDFRGSSRPGTPGADMALIGLRFAAAHPNLCIKPYGQVSIGYLATRSTRPAIATFAPPLNTAGTFSSSFGVIELLGGVDVPVGHYVELRAVEVGIGTGFRFNMYENTNGGNPKLFLVNSGILYHF